MRIGVPRESKDREFRVGVVPDGVRAFVAAGHEVLVEQSAGLGSGFDDDAYAQAGAKIVDAQECWSSAGLIVKVKEPSLDEVAWLHAGQTLFTFLHLAAVPPIADALLRADVVAIAYETIRSGDGSFPVLAPMSEIAGRLASQVGAELLRMDRGGKGVLLAGATGVQRGRVTVLGAGTVGMNAARIAHGLGAAVDVLDVDTGHLRQIEALFGGAVQTLHSSQPQIERALCSCDLLVGAVHNAGRRTPTLVSDAMVACMQAGSVIVDVAVDQGGCVETIHPTTHSDPTYTVHGVVHYGVANMPGAVPRTSTRALTNATLRYALQIAALGPAEALRSDPALARGANLWRGHVVCEGVAESLGLEYTPLDALL